MKKLLMAVLVVAFAASFCYAADEALKANEPVGAAVEETSIFAGNIISIATGQTPTNKPASITVVDSTGKKMMFPIDPTVKIVDAAVNAVTLDQLKTGEKVAVTYSKDQAGTSKAKTVTVTK